MVAYWCGRRLVRLLAQPMDSISGLGVRFSGLTWPWLGLGVWLGLGPWLGLGLGSGLGLWLGLGLGSGLGVWSGSWQGSLQWTCRNEEMRDESVRLIYLETAVQVVQNTCVCG